MTDTITEGSTAVRAISRLRERVDVAAASARTLAVVRRTQDAGRPAAAAGRQEAGETVAEQSIDAQQDAPAVAQEDASDGLLAALLRDATVTGVASRIGTFARSSWLYRWLTAEPEPEIIVIDLRKTRSVGPIIQWLDSVLRELTPATVTSGAVRVGYRFRNRARERPVRVASIATIAGVVLAFLALATTGDPVGPAVLFLVAFLLLALRGTQSTRTWADIAETRWYQSLAAAFEPPEPIEPVEGDAPRSAAETSDADRRRDGTSDETTVAGDGEHQTN